MTVNLKSTGKDEYPSYPGEWPIKEIIKKLSRELPTSLTKTLDRSKGGGQYLPWHRAIPVLNKYAPGWNWEIKDIKLSEHSLFMVGRLTIPAKEGFVYREATGTEELNTRSYGDPSSNAESMCFRRAASKFGLGLYFYDK